MLTMKKNLLVITVFLLALLCKAEEKVFPTSDAIWVVHLFEEGGGEPEEDKQQLVYGLSGDTIISTKNYQKLYLLSDTLLTITEADVYVGGIRQENKKVWMLPADQSDGTAFEEFLLYDFSVELGDSIYFGKRPLIGLRGTYSDGYNFCGSAYFDDVDMGSLINIKGRVSGRYESKSGVELHVNTFTTDNKYDYGLPETWLQGIGSESGLFFASWEQRSMCGGSKFFGGYLICMKEKDEIKYLKYGCTSCFNQPFENEYWWSIESEFADNKAKVSYNIAAKNIKIESDGVNLPLHFKLFSIDGNLITTHLALDSDTEVGIDKLPKGVYIYNITGKNLSQSGKLIIE